MDNWPKLTAIFNLKMFLVHLSHILTRIKKKSEQFGVFRGHFDYCYLQYL
jgi:hypothetical protein